MSKALVTTLAGMALFAVSSLAFAADLNAEVEKQHGKVLVNRGEEFAPVGDGTRLKPGDRIMAQNDSGATIEFDDECKMQVEENTIVTMPEKSPCAGGEPLVQQLNPGGGTAIGTAATHTGNGGVLAMVAIVAAIDIWWLSEDEHDVVSP